MILPFICIPVCYNNFQVFPFLQMLTPFSYPLFVSPFLYGYLHRGFSSGTQTSGSGLQQGTTLTARSVWNSLLHHRRLSAPLFVRVSD